MRKILSVTLILASCCMATLAQRRIAVDTKNSVRVEQNKPSTYLEFVKAGVCYANRTTTIESWSPCEAEKRDETQESYDAVWLRVRNNSRWPINFDVLSVYVGSIAEPYKIGRDWVTAVKDGAELRVRYRVEAEIAWEQVDTPRGKEHRLVDVKTPIVNRVSPTGVTSRLWLPPKRSVILVVKREHLAKHLMVYLPYKYEWDGDQNDLVSKEPQHRVYFSWYALEKATGVKAPKAP
jgi:hypothetical protein